MTCKVAEQFYFRLLKDINIKGEKYPVVMCKCNWLKDMKKTKKGVSYHA